MGVLPPNTAPLPLPRAPGPPPAATALCLCLGLAACSPAPAGPPPAPVPAATALPRGEREALADRLAERAADLFASGEDPRLAQILILEAAGTAYTEKSAEALLLLSSPHVIMPLAGDGVFTSVSFDATGRFVAGSAGGDVTVWDAYTGKEVLAANVGGDVDGLLFDHAEGEGLLLAALVPGEVVVLDVHAAAEEVRLPAAHGSGSAFVRAWGEAGTTADYLAVPAPEGGIGVHDTASWERVGVLPVEGAPTSLAAVDHTRQLLATTDRGELVVWDMADLREVARADLEAAGIDPAGAALVPQSSGGDRLVPLVGPQGVHLVDPRVVREGDAPVSPAPLCQGVFCEQREDRESGHQHLPDTDAPVAYMHPYTVVTVQDTDRLVVWEAVPGVAVDFLRRDTIEMPGPVTAVSGSPFASHWPAVVAVAYADGGIDLREVGTTFNDPYTDADTVERVLASRCASAPVYMGRDEWEREIPEAAYNPVCTWILDGFTGEGD